MGSYLVTRRLFKIVVILSIVTLLLYHLLIPKRGVWFGQFAEVTPSNKERYVQQFHTRTNLPKTMKVLMWTIWFGHHDWRESDLSTAFHGCPVSSCELTNDQDELPFSHALLFHAWELVNGEEDYVMPEFRSPHQVWIFENQEPPINLFPKYKQFNGVFNWTASYRRDSDVQMLSYFTVDKLKEGNNHVEDIAARKSGKVAWIASNCDDDARRQLLVREIEKYMHVDKYGLCGGRKITMDNKLAIIRNSKFYLAFENSYCRDYITEKFSVPLMERTIPIVAGAGDYKSVAPPGSYIHVADFPSAKELTDYLNYLDSNDTAYNEYFDWTREYSIRWGDRWCELCERLHDVTVPAQVYADFEGYMNDDMCQWSYLGKMLRIAQGYLINAGII